LQRWRKWKPTHLRRRNSGAYETVHGPREGARGGGGKAGGGEGEHVADRAGSKRRVKVVDGGGGREEWREGRREQGEKVDLVTASPFVEEKRKGRRMRIPPRPPPPIASLCGGSVSPTASPPALRRFEASRRLTRCSPSCRKAPSKKLSRLADRAVRAGHDLPSPLHALMVWRRPPVVHE
jgi:hypothetical protein